jgi:hypothetical protein
MASNLVTHAIPECGHLPHEDQSSPDRLPRRLERLTRNQKPLRGNFVDSASSPNVPYSGSTIAVWHFAISEATQGGILQEYVIVSAGCGCYSLAERLVLPAFLNLGANDKSSAWTMRIPKRSYCLETEDLRAKR